MANPPIHMAGAWATANGVALGQVKTHERSNETTAIPKLLKMLEIKGCIVTIDAMGCRKKIARQIVKQGADCVLAVKKNQPQLWDDIVGAFEYGERTRFSTMEHDVFETVNKGHGRVERRRCRATSAPLVVGHANDRGEWANMNGAAMIESTRWADGKTTVHRRYFITSLPAQSDRILGAVREHWGVENGLHWTLGAPFGEDGSMIRIGHAAENMSTLRRLALNLVKGEKSLKIEVAAKRKRAGWDLDYLRAILRLAQ